MMSAMDDAVGRVLAKLSEIGQEENTLVVFHADNGGPTQSTTSQNGPLRGFKSTTWEGGVRVPFMLQWKGRLPAGKVYEQPVIQLDMLPTFVAAAGGEVAGRLEARRRQPAAVPRREEPRPAARHAVLAVRPANGHPPRRLEAGQGHRHH